LPEDAGPLAIPLPQAQFNSPGAALVVVPDDEVELIPDYKRMIGLVRQQIDPRMKLPVRQQAPLFYRGEATKAVFAAEVRVHSQKISVGVSSHVDFKTQGGEVEQKLDYTIQYKPADHLTIRMPQRLAKANRLQFLLGTKVLPPPVEVPGSVSNENDGSKTVLRQIILPKGQIGPCQLSVRYALPSYELRADQRAMITVPLIMPAEGELLSNDLQVTVAAGIDVASSPGPWTASATGASPFPQRTLLLSTEERTDQVALQLELKDGANEGTTVVERAWVQTWLTDSARQDRAVFSFTSNRKSLRVTFPEGATVGQMDLWLDGKRLTVATDDDGRLIVPLAGDGSHHRHVLELRPHFPLPRPAPGRMSIEVPELAEDVWIRRLYWQLVLPQNEHVIRTPKGCTSECNWEWTGYFWGRKPLLGSSELETWAGAAATDRSNPVGTNRYLFSTLGNVRRCELRTADRYWIVLIASGGASVAGLLLIYVPVSRHPGSLFGASVVLICVGAWFPEPTLLLAQAASLGLALTLIAGLLERGVARRRRRSMIPETSSSILEKGSTQTQFQPPRAANQISTQTARPVLPPSDSNA